LGAYQVVTDKHATNSTSRLDEESFTRLLAAAYVMQEHQDRMMSKLPANDFTQVISQIVETQHLIQTRKLEIDAALELVASRLQKLTGAAGATVGLLENNDLEYRAACGCVSGLAGSVVRPDDSLSAVCLRSGEKLRSPIVEADPRLNASLRHALRARSLLAVPVFYEAKVAGSVELFFSETSAFSESDVRASELMAGLVTEVLAQAAETKLKKELAEERASVLMALEKLKPQLERLTNEQTALIQRAAEASSESATDTLDCKACGSWMEATAIKCPVCGAAKGAGAYPGTELQGKWAAMWDHRQQQDGSVNGAVSDSAEDFLPPIPDIELDKPKFGNSNGSHAEDLHADESYAPAWPAPAPVEETNFWQVDEERPDSSLSMPVAEHAAETSLVQHSESALPEEEHFEPQPPLETVSLGDFYHNLQQWTKTKLEETSLGRRIHQLWVMRRGDISLAVAACAIVMALIWAFSPSHAAKPQAATTNIANSNTTSSSPVQPAAPERKKRPKPQAPELTAWEKVLVGLGLAEAPPPQPYMGDPNVKVWVDLQSALYYCPSADLYGKTPKGKFTTQGDAQIDQFEPAFRRPCD
jgi:GAF domain-containing protein